MEIQALYDELAGLLAYPGEDCAQRASRCAVALALFEPEAAARMEEFHQRIAGLSTEALQEQYTATFDLNPACSLEVGWHLFGENYERGDFLAKMRRELRRHGLSESTELPDHLTHVLPLLGRMQPEDAEMLASLVFAALDKVREGFRTAESPFALVLDGVERLLESRHPRAQLDRPAAPVLRVWDERGLP